MKRTRGIRRSRDEVIFDAINMTLLIIFSACCLFPLINLFAKAVSSESAVVRGEVIFWPIGFQLESVTFMLQQYGFQRAFLNSVKVTVLGTLLNASVTILAAYPLSRKQLKGRRILQFFVVFTMLFNGGLIPTFILIQRVGLLETHASIILPSACNAYWIIIVRNYFEGIPEALEESAKIDGASNIRIFGAIMLPLALPCVATLIVFAAVGLWNEYFTSLLYLHKRDNFTLQLYLRQLLESASGTAGSMLVNASQMRAMKNKSPLIIQAAAVFLSTVPILVVYPFLQRYFVKGMTLGAVKG